jgi:hypothetical protein
MTYPEDTDRASRDRREEDLHRVADVIAFGRAARALSDTGQTRRTSAAARTYRLRFFDGR